MKSFTLLESKKGNKYLYDRDVKRTHLCHPLLYYIAELNGKSIDVNQWLNKMDDNSTVEIEGCGRFSKEEVRYYHQKYLFLKANGYFTKMDQEKRMSLQLDGESLKRVLANGKQVVFEVTEKCQMNCYYCGYGEFYEYYVKRDRKNLDPGRGKMLLNYLLELWNSPLNTSHDRNIFISFYGGEPLLNFPFITEIVDYVKQLNARHNRFSFSITTNGLLLDKYMDFFYKNNFYVAISLDGNEENNSYRVLSNGKPAYETTLENVKLLQETYPDYFSKYVNIISVLHNRNSVADIFSFIKTHFNKLPEILELDTTGIKESKKEEFWKTYSNAHVSYRQSEDYSLIEKEMFLAVPDIDKVTKFLAGGCDFMFKDNKDVLLTGIEQAKAPTGTCMPFSKKIFLSANGKILPCERIGYQYALGTVTRDKVDLDFAGIAKKYNGYYDNVRKQCNACHNTDTCEQCIFHLNIEDDNPSCKGRMNGNDYSKYLASIVNYIEGSPGTYSKIAKEAFLD